VGIIVGLIVLAILLATGLAAGIIGSLVLGAVLSGFRRARPLAPIPVCIVPITMAGALAGGIGLGGVSCERCGSRPIRRSFT